MFDFDRYRDRGARRLPLLFLAAALLALSACDGLTDGILPDTSPPDVAYVGIDGGDEVNAPDVTIEAFAQDDRAVDDVRWSTNRGAGGPCTFLGGGSWRCEAIPLPVGDTRITIRAWDVAGNVGSASLTVTRPGSTDATAPTVTFLGIDDGDEVTASEVTIEAFAQDDVAVDDVRWSTNRGASGACDALGGGSWNCGPIPLPYGDTLVTLRAWDVAGNVGSTSLTVTRPESPTSPPPSGDFDIELFFYEHTFTSSQLAAFEDAASRWEELVIGDLEDLPFDNSEEAACLAPDAPEPVVSTTVDDLLIFVTSGGDGSVGGVLGIAGPCLSRSSGPDAGTNAVGFMEFDDADLADLESRGNLLDVIVHEMGHVLGIGTNWEYPPYYELLSYTASDGAPDCATASGFTDLPDYVGASGVAAYDDLGGSGWIPVEESGGIGTQCGHWDEETFGNELMTGFLEEGQDNPLSEMTVASLEDIGLTVDTSRADPYTLPLFPADVGGEKPGLDLAGREILLPPRGTIDPDTGEITLFDAR
jgi:hypothetical protein